MNQPAALSYRRRQIGSGVSWKIKVGFGILENCIIKLTIACSGVGLANSSEVLHPRPSENTLGIRFGIYDNPFYF